MTAPDADRLNIELPFRAAAHVAERQTAALDGVARRQKRADASQIDYSEIPALTDKQLAGFRRPAKKLVAVRLDADVFE